VATATLAALVGGGGLGRIITDGFGQQDRPQILAGGLLVAVLALVTELSLALVQRRVTPGEQRRGLPFPGRRAVDPADGSDDPDAGPGAGGGAEERYVSVS
jgi:osmoprotectant transport system permease protein